LKIKSQRDFWSGLMFVVIGAGFAIGATNYSMGTSARPGAGYFPLMLSVIMAILGAIVLFKSLTIESADGDPDRQHRVEAAPDHRRGDRDLRADARAARHDHHGAAADRDLEPGRRRVQVARRAPQRARADDRLVGGVRLGLKLTIPLWPRFFQ
jgi:hypothetical protein